jgi:hypothetical protein
MYKKSPLMGEPKKLKNLRKPLRERAMFLREILVNLTGEALNPANSADLRESYEEIAEKPEKTQKPRRPK